MAASLRDVAACIGVTGSFSVVKDFYGYASGVYGHKSINVDFATTTMSDRSIAANDPGRLSLWRQIELLKTRYMNLDVIRVGGDDFTTLEKQEIDIAVQIARELYERDDIGIGRVLKSQITVADAGSYMSIDSACEAIDLIDDWDAPGNGIDCFFVRSITFGAGGAYDTKGDGLIVALRGDWASGIGLAHELGHFLGVHEHQSDNEYLLVGGGNGFPKPPYKWTQGDLDTVKSSESMRGGCP